MADTAVKQSSAVKNFSEIEQNDVENAVQTAELAAAAGNTRLLQAALADVARLLKNNGPQAPQAQLQQNPTAGVQQV